MDFKKLDELARDLDEIGVTVDELKEESEPIDRQKLEEIDQAIEGASDTVDEIDDAE
jgi:ABC-type transporter Mla subunit MlaD